MVAHSRATVRADQLRPLNRPRPIQVEADARGYPVRVDLARHAISVVQVLDRWRIDDEWWRKEIARMYFRVALATGSVVTIFHDLTGGSPSGARPPDSIKDNWFMQPVATLLDQPEPIEALVPKPQARRSPRKQLRKKIA